MLCISDLLHVMYLYWQINIKIAFACQCKSDQMVKFPYLTEFSCQFHAFTISSYLLLITVKHVTGTR